MRILPYLCIIAIYVLGCEEQVVDTEQLGTNIARYGSLIKVKKEFEERYIILHRNTFPGVLDRIHKSNIRNYSIFINEGLLFSHFEYIGTNFDNDMAQMADPVTKDWWKLTDPMQEPLETRQAGEWWASMALLFQMNKNGVSYMNARRIALVGSIKEDHDARLYDGLKNISNTPIDSILKLNFQNMTLYGHNGRIYFYIEYVGKNYDRDMGQLLKLPEVENLYKDLTKMMEPLHGSDQFWVKMEEVFHTD